MKTIILAALLTLVLSTKASAGFEEKINAGTRTLKTKELKLVDVDGADSNKEQLTVEVENKNANQLPIQAKRTFAKMFEGYQIKQAMYFIETAVEKFYIYAENEKESIIVKIDDTLNISIFKKTKKG